MAKLLEKWRVEFSEKARSQLKKLDKPVQKKIISYLEDRIQNSYNPRSLGGPLKDHLSSYWRYRVGDYRILCILEDGVVTVQVMQISYRREIYE